MKELSKVFAALADETRLEMVALLAGGRELCVCDFMQALGITQSKASRHLRYLHHAGLVDDRREAVWVYYRLKEGLDRSRSAIVGSVKPLLAGERLVELRRKLAVWEKSKKACGPSCATSRPTQTRKRRPA